MARLTLGAALLGACAPTSTARPVAAPVRSVAPIAVKEADSNLDPQQKHALEIVLAFQARRFETVTASFNEQMKVRLQPAELAEWATRMRDQVGELSACQPRPAQTRVSGTAITIDCVGTKQNAELEVVFANADGLVRQLTFANVPVPDPNPPAYAKMDAIVERDLLVGDLPATLTMPKSGSKVPGVVLVHGSGPEDRDETVGANRPFRDLALGLASRGIAVLRYEKRTFGKNAATLAQVGDDLTIDQEVIDDAALAIRTLERTTGIDDERVFVAGHSLGGLCAPRIVAKEPSTKGMILLAAEARPLEDLWVDQVGYLLRARGVGGDRLRGTLEDAVTRADLVKSPNLEKDTPKADLPMRLPAPYWLSLRRYDHLAVASKLGVPTLVLQGERDYQVGLKDFGLWQGALAKNPLAQSKSLPGLNHLFVAGTAPSLPAEYDLAGHVDAEVIDLVASFVQTTK